MLSVIQDLQPKLDLSPFGSLHITCNLSIATSINKIQSISSGQGTWQLFHVQYIWAKCEPPPQELQGILCLPEPSAQTST